MDIKKMIKKMIFMTFVLAVGMRVLGFWETSAEAEVFVNEGFEDGAFSPPYQFLCDPNDPDSPPQTGPCTNTAEHVMTEKKSGDYSLECVFNISQAAGLRIFPADYGHTDFRNKTYLRFYMKWDSDFKFYNRTKIFRWHVPGDDIYLNVNACGSSGVIWDGWWKGFTSYSRWAELTFVRTNQSPMYTVTNEIGNSDWVVEAGTGWYMFEFFYDASTDNFALWVMRPGDKAPTQVINQYFGGPISSDGNGIIDINWINSVSDGSGGKFWIDEIVISDEYIGPINTLLKGDLNNDEIVNIQDVQLCINVILGTETNPEIVARADVNADGLVDNSDIGEIVNIILN